MSLKIDSHQHFWRYDPIRYSWIDGSMEKIQQDFLPQDLEPVLKKHQMDGCIAVQADQSEEETKFLLKLAEENLFIKGVVGWVDLSSPEVADRLEYWSKNPLLKGLRHTVYDREGEYLLDPHFQKGIARLKDFKLTYDLLVYDYQLPGAIKLAQKFPEQPFVLDHLAKPQVSQGVTPEWRRNIEELASYPNVCCKLSGLVTETENFKWEAEQFTPFLEIVYNAFREERLMFGSDWPVNLVASSYSETLKIVENYFSTEGEEVCSKIFGRNAARFYNLV